MEHSLSSPNHNQLEYENQRNAVALYPLSSPNHNQKHIITFAVGVALYPLSSPNHNQRQKHIQWFMLRYILFHHQTTTRSELYFSILGCVISSFITKPQRFNFIPLLLIVALYPLSSPNHNRSHMFCNTAMLRYILFHHQTTTETPETTTITSCVISSFITKPQLTIPADDFIRVALYPLSSPNHNRASTRPCAAVVALYPLSLVSR